MNIIYSYKILKLHVYLLMINYLLPHIRSLKIHWTPDNNLKACRNILLSYFTVKTI